MNYGSERHVTVSMVKIFLRHNIITLKKYGKAVNIPIGVVYKSILCHKLHK